MARHAVEHELATAPVSLRETAVILISELVTNAVLYAKSPVHVSVRETGDVIRFEVSDESSELPELRHPEPDDEGGRGLLLVSSLSSAWGSSNQPPGKVVWFELERSQPD